MPTASFDGEWKDNGLTPSLSNISEIVQTIRDDIKAWGEALDDVSSKADKIRSIFQETSDIVSGMKSVLETISSVTQANQSDISNNLMSINEMVNASKNLGGGFGGGFGGGGGMGRMGGGVSYQSAADVAQASQQSQYGIEAEIALRQQGASAEGVLMNYGNRRFMREFLPKWLGGVAGSREGSEEGDRMLGIGPGGRPMVTHRSSRRKPVPTTTVIPPTGDEAFDTELDDELRLADIDSGLSPSLTSKLSEEDTRKPKKAVDVLNKSMLKGLFNSRLAKVFGLDLSKAADDYTVSEGVDNEEIEYGKHARRAMRAAGYVQSNFMQRSFGAANFYGLAKDASNYMGQYIGNAQQLGGATGVVGMQDYGMQAADFVRSGFGLNPFNSYQAQMQNQIYGANLGLRGGALDNYRGLAINEYQNRLGMNAQQAAQVMGAGLNAGVNINTMTQGLSTVRNMAQNAQFANTQAMTNAYVQGTVGAASWGATNAAATQVGQLGASFMNNNSVLQGQGLNGQGGMYSTMGMAMMANQLGVSYNDMYSQMKKMSGNQVVNTYDKSMLSMLRNAGIPVDRARSADDLNGYAMQLMAIWQSFGQPINDPQTAVQNTWAMIQQSRGLSSGGRSTPAGNFSAGANGSKGPGILGQIANNAITASVGTQPMGTQGGSSGSGVRTSGGGQSATVSTPTGHFIVELALDKKFSGKLDAAIHSIVGATANGSAPTTSIPHRADSTSS